MIEKGIIGLLQEAAARWAAARLSRANGNRQHFEATRAQAAFNAANSSGIDLETRLDAIERGVKNAGDTGVATSRSSGLNN